MTDLIKWEWDVHDNRTFFVLQLILKCSLKEKIIVNLSIVYPRCFNVPNKSILPEHSPNNLIIQK